MHPYKLSHLSNRALLGAVSSLIAQDCATTARLIAHLAEVDARRLYLRAGHPSMFAYCVEALHFSEGTAYKRIRAARAARQFPALFAAIADGRVHLSAVCLLAGHLTAENFDELLAAATHRGKAEVERWLGERFAPPLLVAAGNTVANPSAPAALEQLSPGTVAGDEVMAASPLPCEPEGSAPTVAKHIVVRVALPPATHAKLLHARALLSHAVPSGDLAQLVDRALDALIAQVEERKTAAAPKPRRRVDWPVAKRTIPAQVRREVWRRDQGRCAFVSASGVRCSGRWRLEFDHVVPVARGGTASTERMRLLCRAHNQFEAERRFGMEFMRRKREAAGRHARGGDRHEACIEPESPG